MYIVCTKIITEAKYSVDGKKHIHTNYFKGVETYSFGDVVIWDKNKKDAVKFTDKHNANKIAKRYNGFIREIWGGK